MRSPRRLVPLFLALPLTAGCPNDGTEGDSDGGAATTSGDSTGGGPTGDTTTSAGSSSDGTTGSSGGMDTTADSGSESDSGSDEGTTTGEPATCDPPTSLTTFTPSDGDARGLAVDGDTVFLAVGSGGIEAVDITDPTMPASLGQLDFGPGELAFTVAVEGDHAYVGKRGSGWSVVDVSDPTMMVEVASDDNDDAEDVAVVGTTFFVIDGNGIRTYDVTDPTMPAELSPTVVLPGASNQLEIAGDLALIAASGGGLIAVDIADPSTPTELSAFDTSANATHVVADGTTAYVGHADGVNIVDVSDASMPAELGFFERERAHALAIDGTTLYVLGDDTASTMVPFLSVVDVADASMPMEFDGSFDDFGDPHAIGFAGDLLLVSEEDDDALHIIDPCPTR